MYKIDILDKTGSMMESINSTDAKKSFSDVVLKVQQAPVWITRHDKPVAVVMSSKEFLELQALKEKMLRIELEKGLNSVKAGRVIEGQDGIQQLFDTIDNA